MLDGKSGGQSQGVPQQQAPAQGGFHNPPQGQAPQQQGQQQGGFAPQGGYANDNKPPF